MDPLSARIALGAAGTSISQSYWFATITTAFTGLTYREIAVDSQRNVCIVFTYTNTSTNYIESGVAKFDADGLLLWARKLTITNQNYYIYSIAVDSNNDIYLAGSYGSDFGEIIKYSSAGVLAWKRSTVFALANRTPSFISIRVVDTSTIYLALNYIDDNSLRVTGVVKINSSGTLLWARSIKGASTSTIYAVAEAVQVDGGQNGNAVVIGYADYGSSTVTFSDGFIVSFSSAGNTVFQRRVPNDSNTSYNVFSNLSIDSSNNIYSTLFRNTSTTVGYLLLKHNSSGTLLFSQGYGAPLRSLKVSNTGDIYAKRDVSRAGNISRFDNAGTPVWGRNIAVGISLGNGPVTVDNQGAVYTLGSSSNGMFIGKFPDNGGVPGTYGAYSYTSSSLATSTSNYAETAGSFTIASLSFTLTTSSVVDSSLALASSITPIV